MLLHLPLESMESRIQKFSSALDESSLSALSWWLKRGLQAATRSVDRELKCYGTDEMCSFVIVLATFSDRFGGCRSVIDERYPIE